MKKIVSSIVFLFWISTLWSQSFASLKFIAEARAATDSLLKGSELIDETLLGEASGIVLDNIELCIYEGNFRKLQEKRYQRSVIKIVDKQALDSHSSFGYSSRKFKYARNKVGYYCAIRIIKASGYIEEIKLESLERNANGEVAIPNLEVNDIIDYTVYSELVQKDASCYSSEIESFAGKYPIVNGFWRIYIGPELYVNYKPMNGAPEFIKNTVLTDSEHNVYDMSYRNLKAANEELWSSPIREQKSYKFQVCHSLDGERKNSKEMLGDLKAITTHVSNEQKKITINNIGAPPLTDRTGTDSMKKLFRRFIKGNYRDIELTDAEYMGVAYYFFRFFTVIYSPRTFYYFNNYHTSYRDPNYFIILMEYAANLREIDHQIAFTCKRNISDFEDVIMSKELVKLFGYKDELGNYTYVESPNAYQTIDVIDPALRGQKGLALEYLYSDGTYTTSASPVEIEIPKNEAADNYYEARFSLTLEIEKNILKAVVERSLTGNEKFYNSLALLIVTSYNEDAEKSMLIKGAFFLPDNIDRRLSARVRARTYTKRNKTGKEDFMKTVWEDALKNELTSYDQFELISSGVNSADDTLIVKEVFSMSDLFQKAGPSIIFDFGKIALDRVSFTEEEITNRESDVYFYYPKKLHHHYEVEIPEGYTIKAFETFNDSAENDFGAVEMRAFMEDSILIIDLEVEYKKQYAAAEDWSKLMEFLTPAMKINEAKLVFQKME